MTSRSTLQIDYSRPDWRERLLEIRARNLAGQGIEERERREILKCLVVLAAGVRYAFPVRDVSQVVPWLEPARLPGERGAVGGRTGSYFHIFDLAELLHRSDDAPSSGHIVRLKLYDCGVALRVTRALEVSSLAILSEQDAQSLGQMYPAALALGQIGNQPALTILDARLLFTAASQLSPEVE